jgi:hypothetical protein
VKPDIDAARRWAEVRIDVRDQVFKLIGAVVPLAVYQKKLVCHSPHFVPAKEIIANPRQKLVRIECAL